MHLCEFILITMGRSYFTQTASQAPDYPDKVEVLSQN
jgi:hypothetical protein